MAATGARAADHAASVLVPQPSSVAAEETALAAAGCQGEGEHHGRALEGRTDATAIVAAAGATNSGAAQHGSTAITEQLRCQKAWLNYQAFLATPGGKCPDCWLLRSHCCCSGFQPVALRPQVILLMHHVELSQRRCSNTAKLLLSFGAELFAWGLPEHDQRLRELLSADEAGTVVLFPSEGSVFAQDLAAAPPRRILVLDGGWRETGRMNASLPLSLVRCRVSTARRSDFGGTRKYGNGDGGGEGRVQTAAAFIALLQELGENPSHVAKLRAGLAHFMTCFETQIHRSKT